MPGSTLLDEPVLVLDAGRRLALEEVPDVLLRVRAALALVALVVGALVERGHPRFARSSSDCVEAVLARRACASITSDVEAVDQAAVRHAGAAA